MARKPNQQTDNNDSGGEAQSPETTEVVKAEEAAKTETAKTEDAARVKAEEAARMQARIDEEARARLQAEATARAVTDAQIRREYEEREKLRPMPPIMQAVSAEIARPDEECEVWDFPRPCFIWVDPVPGAPEGSNQAKRLKVTFGRGLQKVPKSLTGNWYLKSVGVPYAGGKR